MGLATRVNLYVGHLDLPPMDFFLWWKMKRFVYETPLDIEEELVVHVTAAAMVMFQTPGIFERTRQSLVRRCYF